MDIRNTKCTSDFVGMGLSHTSSHPAFHSWEYDILLYYVMWCHDMFCQMVIYQIEQNRAERNSMITHITHTILRNKKWRLWVHEYVPQRNVLSLLQRKLYNRILSHLRKKNSRIFLIWQSLCMSILLNVYYHGNENIQTNREN